MTEVFYAILKASFQGSIVILTVMALRFLLKKAPKSLFCLLWLLAGLRLVLPFEIESGLSLQPRLEDTSLPIQAEQQVQIPDILIQNPEGQPLEEPQSPNLPEGNWEDKQTANLLYGARDGVITGPVSYGDIAARIWALGMAVMLVVSAVSYFRLKRRVREAYLIENGCFECPGLETAFVLGFFLPKIYLPTGLTDREKAFIYDHEKTHIARHDHWWKLLGYITLAIHWFNPLVWLAYILLCRDLEMACDEHVVKGMEVADRKAYSAALLSCSSHTARLAACPVAFGESNPKKRILNVLNYKRPGFWISLAAVIAVIFVAVCLLTSPAENVPQEDELLWNLEMKAANVTPSGLTVEFIQHGDFPERGRATLEFGSHYTLQRLENSQWVDVEMLPQEYDVAWTMEAYVIDIGKTAARRENWEWLYGQLPAGHYRIGKDVDLFRTTGDWDSEIFYAEFEITEESLRQVSGEGEAYIDLCREAMMTLQSSEELYLYVTNLDDPMETANVYMHAPNGWLFKYRRPGWDCEEVQWLRMGNTQYLYGGDLDDNGVMTTPYYWQVEQNPDSHNYQLPYPFDLDWENIELTYGGTATENGQEAVTILFPLYLDVFTFYFGPDGELSYFDVGDSSGEPEATTSRFYVQFPYDGTVADYLTGLYAEASAQAGQKPGIPDDAFYEELFTRQIYGANEGYWVYELFRAFYAYPEEFVSHLAGRDRAEEIITFMGDSVGDYAPYRFDTVLTQLRENPNTDPTILALLEAIA